MQVYCNVSYSPRKRDDGWQIPGRHSFEDKRESGDQLLGRQPRGGKVEDGRRCLITYIIYLCILYFQSCE